MWLFLLINCCPPPGFLWIGPTLLQQHLKRLINLRHGGLVGGVVRDVERSDNSTGGVSFIYGKKIDQLIDRTVDNKEKWIVSNRNNVLKVWCPILPLVNVTDKNNFTGGSNCHLTLLSLSHCTKREHKGERTESYLNAYRVIPLVDTHKAISQSIELKVSTP